jgi:ribosomal subunit interface protein
MATTENMRFFFKGLEIDLPTRDYIEKRLDTMDKFIENITKSEVEIDMDKKGKFRVEVMLHTPRNMFRADNTTESIEASIDLVADELQAQITHMKDKLRTLKKRGAMSIKKKTVLDEGARF